MECTKIIKFKNLLNSERDYFEFVDAVYIITVKKKKITKNQKNCIKNINMLGCQNKTYWCVTKGYKDNACDHTIPEENLCYNHKKITEDAIKNNYENITIFEDDFIINIDPWKDYDERRKSIKMLINENKKNAMVIYLGYFPLFSTYVNDRISKGRYLYTHAYLMNRNAIVEMSKLKVTETCGSDRSLLFNLNIKFYAIKPNNLFFQENDKNSLTAKYYDGNIGFALQKLVTKRDYYQYDPKFAKYYDPFVEGFSTTLKMCTYLCLINFISKKI